MAVLLMATRLRASMMLQHSLAGLRLTDKPNLYIFARRKNKEMLNAILEEIVLRIWVRSLNNCALKLEGSAF
jgi:hypothetical protein